MKGLKFVHLILLTCLAILTFALTGCMITYRLHQWNLLVYMNGDNNLEEWGIGDINEMEFAGPTAYVNVFVLFDRIPGYDSSNGDWTGTRLYKIDWDTNQDLINSQLLADYGELDMSDPATLQNFIITCNRYSPAEHTILSIWNHGNGVNPRSVASPTEPINPLVLADTDNPLTKAISEDITTGGPMMTNEELKNALFAARAVTGKKIDIVIMDACLMLMLEIAHELRAEADYLLGSETLIPGDGNNYYGILQFLKSAPSNARELAIAIVDTFYTSYSSTSWNGTYSALSLGDDFSQLISAFEDFATALRYTSETAGAVTSWSNAASCFYLEFKDLYAFAEQTTINMSSDLNVTGSATALMSALNTAVIRHYNHGGYVGETHGLSILLPGDLPTWYGQYRTFPLCIETDWDEFIDQFVLWQ